MNAPTVSCIDFPWTMDTVTLHTLDLDLYMRPLQQLDLVYIQRLELVVLSITNEIDRLA